MSPEDAKLWKMITDTVSSRHGPSAAAIGPSAPLFLRPLPMVLDLHGKTIHAAFQMTKTFATDSYWRGLRHVTVITGRSGPICKEFPHWTKQLPEVRRVETLNGGGAFRLHFKRR